MRRFCRIIYNSKHDYENFENKINEAIDFEEEHYARNTLRIVEIKFHQDFCCILFEEDFPEGEEKKIII